MYGDPQKDQSDFIMSHSDSAKILTLSWRVKIKKFVTVPVLFISSLLLPKAPVPKLTHPRHHYAVYYLRQENVWRTRGQIIAGNFFSKKKVP